MAYSIFGLKAFAVFIAWFVVHGFASAIFGSSGWVLAITVIAAISTLGKMI